MGTATYLDVLCSLGSGWTPALFILAWKASSCAASPVNGLLEGEQAGDDASLAHKAGGGLPTPWGGASVGFFSLSLLYQHCRLKHSPQLSIPLGAMLCQGIQGRLAFKVHASRAQRPCSAPSLTAPYMPSPAANITSSLQLPGTCLPILLPCHGFSSTQTCPSL